VILRWDRIVALLLLALVTSSCSGDLAAAKVIDCHVFYREAAGERRQSRHVSVGVGSRSETVIRLRRVTVHVISLKEEGTSGSLVVAVRDARQRELARGLYQFADELRNQFTGQHGFTGLVIWGAPETGEEVQFYCNRDEGTE
jgi:hypothetical protein